MPENQFKRHIAYKLRIGDILIGKPIVDEDRFSFLELGNKKIVRINVVGNIVDKYEREGEKKYSFLTLDDGSGQIRLKSFGDDTEKFKNIIRVADMSVDVFTFCIGSTNITFTFPSLKFGSMILVPIATLELSGIEPSKP